MLSKHISSLILQSLGHSPTADQKDLIDKLSLFIVNEDINPIFIIKGYAGTGKTSIIAALVNVLKSMNMKAVLAAPTGRAAKVMSTYSGESATTIHKKIYRQKAMTGDNDMFSLSPNLYTDTVFIIDEASMIAGNTYDLSNFGTGNLLDDLMSYVLNGTRCKIILCGDTAQLPPVGFSTSPALDESRLFEYGAVTATELKEVVRQDSESGILYNATRIRKQIEENNAHYPKFKVSGYPDIESVNGAELIEAISDSYHKYGADETIILCRSNKRAGKFNEGIRHRVLYMEEEIETGDKLMIVKNNYSVKDNEKLDFVANGDMAVVRRIKKYKEMYGMRYADVSLELEDYDNLEIDTRIMLDTLHLESASLSNEESRELFYGIAQDYSHIGDKRKRYKAIRDDDFFNALQVKFAYAVTCHKAQGGQWKSVFIDKPFLPDDVTIEDLRWFYTAVTRATEKLYLINFDEENIE